MVLKKYIIYTLSLLFIISLISIVINYSINNKYTAYNEETANILIAKINKRVDYINGKRTGMDSEERYIDGEHYADIYVNGKLIFRYTVYETEILYDDNGNPNRSDLYYSVDEDKYYGPDIAYSMYYDDNKKLIYANVVHYRGPNYSIYFNHDELLYVEMTGAVFARDDLYVKGGMKELKEGIKTDDNFSFILTDIENCLNYAYKGVF